MAKSSRPRKNHVRKSNDPVTIRFNEEDERNFQLIPHAELTNLAQGNGTALSWDTIELRLKWGYQLATLLEQPLFQENIQKALDGLLEVQSRFERLGQYGISGAENTAIGLGLNLTDDLQLNATRRELRDTLNQTFSDLRTKPYAAGRLNCLAA